MCIYIFFSSPGKEFFYIFFFKKKKEVPSRLIKDPWRGHLA